MTDALLDLSARLEHIQHHLRTLAALPEVMRAQNNPITMPEALAHTEALETMVDQWTMRPAERRRLDRRRLLERRLLERRQAGSGGTNGGAGGGGHLAPVL